MTTRKFFGYLMVAIGVLVLLIGGGCALTAMMFTYPIGVLIAIPILLIGWFVFKFGKKLTKEQDDTVDPTIWD